MTGERDNGIQSLRGRHFKVKRTMLERIFVVISATAVLLAQQPGNPSRSVDLLLGKARALEARGRLDLAGKPGNNC
jgi:hypothetical protein